MIHKAAIYAERPKGEREMAKRKVNKTAMVRDYLAKHPNAGPSEVSKALKAQDSCRLCFQYQNETKNQ